MIPIYEPDLSDLEFRYLCEAFKSGWISSKGPFMDRFEEAFTSFIGHPNQGVSVSNGTVALHLALLASDVKPGDEILVPNFTYVASANAIRYVNATPVFFGSDAFDLQPSVTSARAAITERTRAIILPHLYGCAADIYGFSKLAEESGLLLIEDCAESIGTTIDGKHLGLWGNISTFSFFGNKTMTTGEGGMVFARDSAIENKIRILKNQGLSQSGNYFHEALGYNYRMTNLQAAIGCAQVERLETILDKKNQNHHLYRNYLKNSSTVRLLEPVRGVSSYWMETVILEDSKQRDKVRHALEAKGIETRPGFTDMTNLSFYAHSKKSSVGIYGLGESLINLPSGSKLTERQIELVTEALKESLANL